MDILLVLGNIEPKQYDPLRFAMLQQGLRPKIVRIIEPRRSTDLFGQILSAWEKENGPATEENLVEFDAWSDRRTDEVLASAIERAFNGSSTNDVKALLFPVSATIGDDWYWITKSIPHTVPCYQVMQAENDDSEYLRGSGFGETFDIKK